MGLNVARRIASTPGITTGSVTTGPGPAPGPTATFSPASTTPPPNFTNLTPTSGLPRTWVTSTSTPGMLGISHGSTTSQAATAVILGVSSVAGLVAATPAHAQDVVTTTPTAPVDLSLARTAADIEARRATMTATELAESRRELYSAYVDATAATTAPAADTSATLTRGERRVDRLLREMERRMEVTAYDMAHPGSYTPIEGRPGYKAIPESELVDLLKDAISDIPIGELPGGQGLARLVRALPNTSHLDVENMSYNELRQAVGASNREALREYFRPFLEKHKRELAIGGFATITAVRAASPEAARALDRVIPRIEIYDRASADGRYRGEASLRYRDARVLPDIDVTGSATRRVGIVDLRATATGTVAFTGDQPVTGTLGAGARITGDRGWVDLEGTIDHTRRSTVRLSGVLDVPDEQLVGRGSITGTFGEGVARGNAGGRVELETSLDKRLNLGRGVDGSVGVYGAVGVDTDGRNEDVRAGVMFRLRW